jgi:hypothetical protein
MSDPDLPFVLGVAVAVVAVPALYFTMKRMTSKLALPVAILNAAMGAWYAAALVRSTNGFWFLPTGGSLAALVGGTIVAASALSVWLTVHNRPGPLMLIVAAVGAFHLVSFGAPFLELVAHNPSAFSLALADDFSVPASVIIPLWAAVFLAPFAVATAWALQRAVATE